MENVIEWPRRALQATAHKPLVTLSESHSYGKRHAKITPASHRFLPLRRSSLLPAVGLLAAEFLPSRVSKNSASAASPNAPTVAAKCTMCSGSC